MKSGTKFEKLTEKIFAQLVKQPDYEKVEHDIKLEGKDGPRQIDVLITSEIAGMKIKTIIECKDYKGKVSVGVVDSLHSVMQDVNANKGVLVSSNGFSSTAINKAKRLGISLYTAHEALSEKWKIDIEIPVLVTEISSVNANPTFQAFFNKGDQIHRDAIFNVNDIDVVKALANDLKKLSSDTLAQYEKSEEGYCPTEITPPFYIRDINGNKKSVDNFLINYEIKKKYYFGYLNEQNDVTALRDVIEGGINIVFKTDFIIDYKNTLKRIKKEEIPSVGEINIACITQPEFDDYQIKSVEISKIG
ncbi:hypothetical protein CBX96_16220 [Shewanella sp. BC20]|uniref:restriction endonuclease n=1 Tax=Shewanella sp. BC20 TaxID=2004459 RepID=UPI000D6424B4|nr:restriction endonuclease [Shewanella sp. BC20]PWF62397.1 hypothetical protein CBX96_16220 [Shewanella sp. BC20]